MINCTGNGVTDVTACLQQAIDDTPPGKTLNLLSPMNAYLISAPLIVSKPITICGDRSLIKQSKTGKGCFQINSSGVKLKGLVLQGQQYLLQNAAEVAIQAFGASAASPINDLTIEDCVIQNWGMYGILFKYVDGFTFRGCKIDSIRYGGIVGLSVLNGTIRDNFISNVVAIPNAYGIAMTRLTTDVGELVTNPRSSNILIAGNIVKNVLNWEGIDTHGGSKISVLGNSVLGCARGITLVDCPNFSNVPTYAPKDCVVMGNVIDSGSTDGTKVYGIVVAGSSSAVGTPTDLAEGCTVVGNTVRGYGVESNPLGIAMYFVSTRGLIVNGNSVIEPGKNGIGLYYNNYGFSVTGNLIQDAWSNSQQAVGINILSDWNKGVIGGNSLIKGTKVATHVMELGMNVFNGVNNYVTLGKDYSEAGTYLYDPGSRTH